MNIRAVNQLTAQRHLWKPVGAETFDGVFFTRYGHHYIFFRELTHHGIGIISVLHENMDIPSRLKEDSSKIS